MNETAPQPSAIQQQTTAPPMGWLGVTAIIFGCILSGVKALIWSRGFISDEVIGYALGGVLFPALIAYAIAGRVRRRNWNKFGLWFAAFCMFFLLTEISSLKK